MSRSNRCRSLQQFSWPHPTSRLYYNSSRGHLFAAFRGAPDLKPWSPLHYRPMVVAGCRRRLDGTSKDGSGQPQEPAAGGCGSRRRNIATVGAVAASCGHGGNYQRLWHRADGGRRRMQAGRQAASTRGGRQQPPPAAAAPGSDEVSRGGVCRRRVRLFCRRSADRHLHASVEWEGQSHHRAPSVTCGRQHESGRVCTT